MRTIVGGRPQGEGGGGENLPRGMEVLLLKASVDDDFRDLLGRDWRGAAGSIDLELTDSERAILDSVPGPVLVEMSTRMRVKKADRQTFLGRTAAAMLALLAGASVASCSPPPPPPPAVPGPAFPILEEREGANEPPSWSRAPVIIIAGSMIGDPIFGYESADDVKQPGDTDSTTVNEPFQFSPPPLFIAGIAPERNDRYRRYESEDEPDPEPEEDRPKK